jgi:hypothetical protein
MLGLRCRIWPAASSAFATSHPFNPHDSSSAFSASRTRTSSSINSFRDRLVAGDGGFEIVLEGQLFPLVSDSVLCAPVHYEAHSKQGWHRVGGLSGEWLHRSVVAKNLLLVIDDNRKFDAHSWYHIPEFPYVSFIFGGVWTPITTRP